MGFFERRRQQKLEALWARANEALSSEDYAKALGVLDQIVGADGENIDAFLLKFDALRKLKRHDEAKTLLSNLSQWSTAEARDRVALEQARVALEDRLWMQAWRTLPKTPVPQQPWLWLEAALRCCYELQDAGEFQRNVKQYWNEGDAEKADEPGARRAVSAIHTLLGSFLEDDGTPGPETTAKIEQHYRKALELWPGNAEAQSCLEDILHGQRADEGETEGGPLDGDVIIHTSIEFGAAVEDTETERDVQSAAAASAVGLEATSPTGAPATRQRALTPDDAPKAAAARATAGLGSVDGGLSLRPLRLQPSEQADWLEAVASAARYRGSPDYAFRIRVELAKHIAIRGDAARAQTVLLSFDGSSPPGPDLVAFGAQLEAQAPEMTPGPEGQPAPREEIQADSTPENKADGTVDEKAALILFDLLTGQLDAAQALLAEAQAGLGTAPESGTAADLDFLEGQLHLMYGRHAEAVSALNRAREADRWKPEVYPRLVLAHLFARDTEGLEWAFGQWEKWLEAGLDTESAEELARWETPLDSYLELGEALGRLASFRLQRWKWSLMKNGFGNSRGFQSLYDADARLRVQQDRPPELVREILFRLTGGMDLELAGYLSSE